MENIRKKTKEIAVGALRIGGTNKIAVQSMTNTRTTDIPGTVAQIKALEESGCDIVRLAVYDKECLLALKSIKDQTTIPIVADVHFDYRLAIGAIENGVDKLRINPGNIKKPEYIKLMADCAKAHNVPIRVGANAGSLDVELVKQYGVCPESVCRSVEANVRLLEKVGFSNMVLSAKCSDVRMMVESYARLSGIFDYPLHIGVTEAGTYEAGTVKNSMGIGCLLLKGIGDTIRVSLTTDPIKEVSVGRNILTGLGLLKEGVEIISCPTCGRTRVDIEKMAAEVAERTKKIKEHIVVAVMGCVVNGPGEAKEADIGIAGGETKGAIFKQGQLMGTVESERLVDVLVDEIYKICTERHA